MKPTPDPGILQRIHELGKDPDLVEKITQSIAPGIIGHDNIKQALLLHLVGGVPKQRNGYTSRGVIHVLLIGDPRILQEKRITKGMRQMVRNENVRRSVVEELVDAKEIVDESTKRYMQSNNSSDELEAIRCFEAAVDLVPDYLDAWIARAFEPHPWL